MSWQEAIDRPGAAQLKTLVALLYSRPYFDRIPDQSLIASDNGAGASHMQACRDINGSYGFVYLPQGGQSVTVDTSNLTGQSLRASWYDPRSASVHTIGDYAREHQLTFTSPDSVPDWVLVLDDVMAQVGLPGVLLSKAS